MSIIREPLTADMLHRRPMLLRGLPQQLNRLFRLSRKNRTGSRGDSPRSWVCDRSAADTVPQANTAQLPGRLNRKIADSYTATISGPALAVPGVPGGSWKPGAAAGNRFSHSLCQLAAHERNAHRSRSNHRHACCGAPPDACQIGLPGLNLPVFHRKPLFTAILRDIIHSEVIL